MLDLHDKAVQLLEQIANSVYERDTKTQNLICFSSQEVLLVEQWLQDLMKDCVCLPQ